MSYGLVGIVGDQALEVSSIRSGGSAVGWSGRILEVVRREEPEELPDPSRHASSLSTAKCATPEIRACVSAPPSSSNVTSSWVTALSTSGPVTNM